MRDTLRPLSGQRGKYRGRFIRYGRQRQQVNRTVLLRPVVDADNQRVADHLWLPRVAAFDGLQLEQGDWIEFVAVVEPYQKGHRRSWLTPVEWDFNLRPERVRKMQGQ